MVREPGLSSLAFASDPIGHEQAIVGVAISLHYLDVHVLTTDALSGIGIGRSRFDPQVEIGYTGNMGKVKARTNGGVARRGDGKDVIVYFGVAVESEPLAEIGQPPGKVNRAEARAGIVAAEFL